MVFGQSSSAEASSRVQTASAIARCFLGERRWFSLFFFCALAEGTTQALSRRSRGRKAGKRARVMEKERGFSCSIRCALSSKTRTKESEEKKKKTLCESTKREAASPFLFPSLLLLFAFACAASSSQQWQEAP
jgi:hypothetical protein